MAKRWLRDIGPRSFTLRSSFYSINLAELFGFEKTDMQIRVEVGVQKPEAVDVTELAKVFPYGQTEFHVRQGGLDIPRPEGTGNTTIIANVALSVSFDMERAP